MKQDKLFLKVATLLFVCCMVLLHGEGVQATEVNEVSVVEDAQVFDIANSSVSTKNAGAGDVITWKIRLQEAYKTADSYSMSLRCPNGEQTGTFDGLVETDEEGAYILISYTVSEIGQNGKYGVYLIEIYDEGTLWKDVYDQQSIDYYSGDTLVQDFSTLAVQVSGLQEDDDAPEMDIDKISVEIEEQKIQFFIPAKDSASGIYDIDIMISCFNKVENIWEETCKGCTWICDDTGYNVTEVSGGYLLEWDLEDFIDFLESEQSDTYSIDYITLRDRAFNQIEYTILPSESNKRIGIDAIPENLQFTVENTEEYVCLDLEQCSVSPKIAGPGETVTWKLKFCDDYQPSSLSLTLDCVGVCEKFIDNWELDKEGYYTGSFTLPKAGYNGSYQVKSICYEKDSGNTVYIKSEDYGAGDVYQDFSNLNFQAEGLPEDSEAPTVDIKQVKITRDGDDIYVNIPAKDEVSGVDEISISWTCFNVEGNIWEPSQCGLMLDESNWVEKEKCYIAKKSLNELIGILKMAGATSSIDMLGIGCILVMDAAGNESCTYILPGNYEILPDYSGWAYADQRKGVDIIPANLRFAVTEEGMNWEQEASREEVTDKKPISTDVTTEGTADKKSTSTESETSTEAKQEIEELPVTGTKETVSGVVYKVTKSSAETKEVTYVESTDKKKTTVKIPDTVTIDGQSYKVTAIANKALKNNKKIKTVTIGKNVTKIGKEAFSGCKNLKKIIIKSSTLKSVDKNAIKNINENATIKVPKKQLSKYKKLFKSKTGYKKSMKIKK